MRIPLAGTAVGTLLVLTIAFIAQRYLGDWIPFVAIGSLAGTHTLLTGAPRRPQATACHASTGVLVVVGVLVVASIWINGSLALWFQRLDSPYPDALRADFVTTQYEVSDALGTGTPQADFVTRLPARPPASGTTAVVGDYAGIYWSDGDHWRVMGGTPAGGIFRLHAALPPIAPDTWRPLLAWPSAAGPDILAVRRDRAGLHVAPRHPPAGRLGAVQRPRRSARRRLRRPDHLRDRQRLHHSVCSEYGSMRVDAYQRSGVTDLPSGTPVVGRATVPGVAPTYGVIRAVTDDRLCRAIRDARTG